MDHLPSLRETVDAFGLAARKSLGQHFLLDLNLTRRIARAAQPFDGATVIEVGPGPGGLTRALLAEGAARIVAIERDQRCVAALAPLVDAAASRLSVIEADALEVDEAALGPPPRLVVANLPYNIATPLLIKWLDRIALFRGLVLMMQKEVAERVAARPGDDAYGRLGVRVGWVCEARRLFDVSPRAFTPPPKVTSSVVRLEPRPAPLCAAEPAAFERVLAAAFGQRRKMLRAALRALGVDTARLLAEAGVEPTARAENLPIEAFCALARAYRAQARA
ncbi:MAG: 16S rRNA (adenine(1518)-N(6)/adenine(1519)-N(6))-dimethyltransferase RsmA [Alphaproteobacteria bacterium]